jgi:hypothetical protein
MGKFALQAVLACLMVGAMAAVLVGTEARVQNGLALTNAEIMIDGAMERPRVVVEAR